jgi:Surface antigen variable number repeat
VSKRLWPATVVILFFSGLVFAQGNLAPALAIRYVRFDNAAHLLPEQRDRITLIMRQTGYSPGSETTVEQATRNAYADKGYWQAKVKVEASPADGQVDVTVRALTEGPAYKLGSLRWTGVSAFQESDLARLVPLHPGKILERTKIAEAIDAIRRAYFGGGYLSYSATPEVEMNDHDGTAELRINVNEGGLFTVQSFDVIGVAPDVRMRLLQAWPFRAGDVYRGENVENFVSVNSAMLPTAISNDVVCRTVDLSNHTVEFVLDFRPQPLACNGPQEIQVTSNR